MKTIKNTITEKPRFGRDLIEIFSDHGLSSKYMKFNPKKSEKGTLTIPVSQVSALEGAGKYNTLIEQLTRVLEDNGYTLKKSDESALGERNYNIYKTKGENTQ